MAGIPEGVTVRQLSEEEWERLRPQFSAEGEDALPNPEYTGAVVAEFEGEIIGMFNINLIVHAGALRVNPEWRGRGISDAMGAKVEDLIKQQGGKGYLMFPSNERSEAVARRMGLKETSMRVYERSF